APSCGRNTLSRMFKHLVSSRALAEPTQTSLAAVIVMSSIDWQQCASFEQLGPGRHCAVHCPSTHDWNFEVPYCPYWACTAATQGTSKAHARSLAMPSAQRGSFEQVIPRSQHHISLQALQTMLGAGGRPQA